MPGYSRLREFAAGFTLGGPIGNDGDLDGALNATHSTALMTV